MAQRYDIGTLRPPKRLADGRLRVDGHLTRSGVFEYREADGKIRREYRPDAEVFRPTSLETFSDVIVTDDHPTEMITAENARALGVGQLSGAPRRDGNHVAATLVLNDAATIAKVVAGKAELSCGYECDLDATPGETPEGERYDAVQTNIRGNHVAIVEVARAGRSARMRIDAAEQIPTPDTNKELAAMSDTAKSLAELTSALQSATARADAADKALADTKAAHAGELAKLEAARDAAQAALVAEQAARKDAAESERGRVRARLQLEAVAERFVGAEAARADASDRELRALVLAKLVPSLKLDGKHDAYVEARFDTAVERADAGDAAVDHLRVEVETGRQDGGIGEAEKARLEMLERNRNAHKTAR